MKFANFSQTFIYKLVELPLKIKPVNINLINQTKRIILNAIHKRPFQSNLLKRPPPQNLNINLSKIIKHNTFRIYTETI
jgi:hypothetical protein